MEEVWEGLRYVNSPLISQAHSSVDLEVESRLVSAVDQQERLRILKAAVVEITNLLASSSDPSMMERSHRLEGSIEKAEKLLELSEADIDLAVSIIRSVFQ